MINAAAAAASVATASSASAENAATMSNAQKLKIEGSNKQSSEKDLEIAHLKTKLQSQEALLKLKISAEKGVLLPLKLMGHVSHVYTTVLSRDGETLFSAGEDKTICIWDLKTGQCIKTLSGHTNSIFSLILSRDEKTLFSAGLDKTIRMWSVEQGALIKTLQGSKARIHSLALSEDGETLAAAGADECVSLWSIKNGTCIKQLAVRTPIFCVVFAANSLAAAGQDNSIKIWSLQDFSLKELQGHTSLVSNLAISHDGKILVSASADTTIRIWSLDTITCQSVIPAHKAYVSCLALSPNGEILISGSQDKSIKIWSVNNGSCLRELKFEKSVQVLSPLSKDYYFAMGCSDGSIYYQHAYTFQEDSLIAIQKREKETEAFCKEIEALKQMNQSLQKEKESLQSTLSFQKEKVEAAQAKELQMKETLQGREIVIQNLTATIAIRDQEKLSLKNDNDILKEGNEALQMDLAAQKKTRETSETALLQLQATVSDQKKQIISLTEELAAQRRENLSIANEKTEFQAHLINQQKSVDESQQNIARLQNSSILSQKEVERLKEALEKVDIDLKQRTAKLDELMPKLKEMDKQKQAYEELKKHDALLQTQLKSLQEELFSIQQENEALKIKLINRQKEIEELKTKTETLQKYIIEDTQLTRGKKISEDTYIIYEGRYHGQEVAIKELPMNPSPEAIKELNTEAQTLSKLHSPFIVQFFGLCLSPKYCLVMEYMQNGNLSAYLESHTKLDWQIKARMIFEMTSGLAELHAKDIIHRDINGSNVLLDKDLHVKLTDFGFAKVKKDLRTFTKSKSKGHLALEKNSSAKLGWMAPEVFNVKADYSKASDVYSLGMTMWQIITQKAPFEDDPNPKAIDQRIIAGNVETIPADCPPKYSSLILYCWRKSAAERPTAQSMLEYLKSAQDSDTYLPNKAGVTAVATSATAAHTMVKK